MIVASFYCGQKSVFTRMISEVLKNMLLWESFSSAASKYFPDGLIVQDSMWFFSKTLLFRGSPDLSEKRETEWGRDDLCKDRVR